MDKAQLQTALENIDVWLLIFGVIVVIGVGGESIFGIRHWWNSRKLQTILQNDEKEREERIAELNKEAAQLRKDAEGEKLKRLQLQRSVFHRMIPQVCHGTKCNWDSLKPFKGTKVVFEYWPTTGEPAMFSGNVAPFAINSGWAMLDKWWTKPADRELPEGIIIKSWVGSNGEIDQSSQAADAFAEFLKANGMAGVRRVPSKYGELPHNSIKVLIGPMPDPFAQE